VLEYPFRELHADRLALAGLTERIGGDEPNIDRESGPRVRREVVIAGGLRLLEMQPRQRRFELDRLVGIASFTPDHGFDRFDPVIIARLIVDAQGRVRRSHGRLGKADLRWVVVSVAAA